MQPNKVALARDFRRANRNNFLAWAHFLASLGGCFLDFDLTVVIRAQPFVGDFSRLTSLWGQTGRFLIFCGDGATSGVVPRASLVEAKSALTEIPG
jgi:hypothetical protein